MDLNREEEEVKEEEEVIVENPVYNRTLLLVFRRETLGEETVVAQNITRQTDIVSGVTSYGDYVAFPQTTFTLDVSRKKEEKNGENKDENKAGEAAAAAAA